MLNIVLPEELMERVQTLCAFLRAKHENAYLAGPESLDFAGLIHAADERIPVETLTFGSEAIYQLLQCFHE